MARLAGDWLKHGVDGSLRSARKVDLMPAFTFTGLPRRDYATLLREVPLKAIPKATRSTVPLLDFWRDSEGRLRELGDALGLDLSDAELHFECAVPVGRGKGKASFTDLMIVTAAAAVGIEAKFTEPLYANVKKWLGTTANPNRQEVLAGWLDMISSGASVMLRPDQVLGFPYQLIHRTASVCSIQRSRRALVYQVFGNKPIDRYTSLLREFRRELGSTSGVDLWVLECPAEPLPPGENVAECVRDALCAGPLFAFGEPSIHRIG